MNLNRFASLIISYLKPIKLAIVIFAFGFFISTSSFAVPEIDAEEFNVRLLRTSSSKRVLLLEDINSSSPRPGRVLLLKDGDKEVAAIRVLKSYEDKIPQRFAAKIVIRFSNDGEVISKQYRALRKLGDRVTQLVKEADAKAGILDMNRVKSDEALANEIPPDDSELDRGIPKPAEKKPETEPATTTENKQPPPLFTKDGIEIDDLTNEDPSQDNSLMDELGDSTHKGPVLLDPFRHGVSIQYASYRAIGYNATDRNYFNKTYSAVALKYSFTAANRLFFKTLSLQDQLSFDLTGMYFSIVEYFKTGDAVQVFPILLNARYTLLVSENFGFFVYAGVKRNFVSYDDPDLTTAVEQLQTTGRFFGGGVQLRIGPQWALRADIGTEGFAVGATLRF